jgi:hypothetical protein
MATRSATIDARASDGSILIPTLWILAILALLGVGLGSTTWLDQRLVRYQRDRLAALYVAKAGYVRAIVELERDATPQLDCEGDSWAHNPKGFQGALGPGSFTVSYPVPAKAGAVAGAAAADDVVHGVLDEDRKVNVNTAPKAVLQELPGMTEGIADAILEWRRSKRGLTELRERSFEVLEELLLVDGMTEDAFRAVQPFITIYTDGKVNLNTAPPEVLKALGMEGGVVAKLLRLRTGLDNRRGTVDDQCITSLGSAGYELDAFESLTPQEAAQLANAITRNWVKVTSSVFRIQSRGAAGAGKAARSVEGVVRRRFAATERAAGSLRTQAGAASGFIVSPAVQEPR